MLKFRLSTRRLAQGFHDTECALRQLRYTGVKVLGVPLGCLGGRFWRRWLTRILMPQSLQKWPPGTPPTGETLPHHGVPVWTPTVTCVKQAHTQLPTRLSGSGMVSSAAPLILCLCEQQGTFSEHSQVCKGTGEPGHVSQDLVSGSLCREASASPYGSVEWLRTVRPGLNRRRHRRWLASFGGFCLVELHLAHL